MDKSDLESIVELCKNLAEVGANEAWAEFKSGDYSQKFKGDTTVVTSADTKIEQLYRKEIAKKFPDHDISGEELGESKRKSHYRWYLDPIDGTTNFTMGVPMFGTMVACTYKRDVVASAVGTPGVEAIYWAGKGMGAYRGKTKLEVNDNVQIDECVIAVDRVNLGNFKTELLKFMFKYDDSFYKMKYFGSVAMIASLVAEGKMNGYIGFGRSAHDFVPVSLLVTEAGGVCLNRRGNKWRMEDDLLVLGNRELAEKLVEMVNDGV